MDLLKRVSIEHIYCFFSPPQVKHISTASNSSPTGTFRRSSKGEGDNISLNSQISAADTELHEAYIGLVRVSYLTPSATCTMEPLPPEVRTHHFIHYKVPNVPASLFIQKSQMHWPVSSLPEWNMCTPLFTAKQKFGLECMGERGFSRTVCGAL